MAEFLDAFWPNLAATAIGVVLGLPVALYLNRQFTIKAMETEVTESKKLLSDAITTLVESCVYNIKVLNNMNQLSLDGQVMRNPDLRTTTWGTLSVILVHHLRDPGLLEVTSHHWLRLNRLEELNSQVFAMQTGQAPLPQEPITLADYICELHRSASDLAAHAHEISERLQHLQGQGAS
ncbi:hypothetical protein SAMN05216271_3689 [Halopseudomonas sabulinigri]|uniref:DUF2489 domain-containing protein n=1 Tax=Halopseudomonas sabulinigri TaxID=472181 RepID=A0A1H1XVX8_9GAMM|nr:hypothetical protein [Halopseudomonas sabulinigri]SDT13362.1 hypothetical protein SAMN05216271_3689 [Halopseudomonas sabulinigri]